MERAIKAEEKAVVPVGSPITLGQQPNNLPRPKVDWWSKYVWKLLWIVGLFAIIIISYQLEQSIRQHVATTFNMLPYFWFHSIVPAVFGAYIALLFVKAWSVKLDLAIILCVTIPCLLIAFYGPVIFTIVLNTTSTPDSNNVPIPLWMHEVNSIGIPSVVAGLTLIVGLFGGTKQAKK